MSVTTTPVASSGPLLATVMVYVTTSPSFGVPSSTTIVRTRSAEAGSGTPTVVDCVAESFAGVVSPIPVTLAVLITEPETASAGTSTCTVIVQVLPAASDARVHETTFAVSVHEPWGDGTPVTVNAGGTGSVTTTFGAASGPAFETTIEYENESPGSTGSAESVLTMERSSTMGVTVSVSVAEPLAAFGSATGEDEIVAVFTRVAPTYVVGIATTNWYAMEAPEARTAEVVHVNVTAAIACSATRCN